MKRKYFFKFVALVYAFSILIPLHGLRAESDIQSSLAKRIEGYKNSYPVNLATEDEQIIADGCDVIKQKLVNARSRVNSTTTNRENVYGNIERRLAAVQNRLSLQRLDTSVVDLSLASYRIEVTNFKNSADKYLSILDDAILIDCKTDPSAFKSTIIAAREARQLPVNAMKRLRDVYNSTLMAGFKILENQLNGK